MPENRHFQKTDGLHQPIRISITPCAAAAILGEWHLLKANAGDMILMYGHITG
jgi:hypothetical protein